MYGVEVSVIIPVRNGADLIRSQLEALTCQDFDNQWETIVADNGSTDGLPAVLAEYAGRLPGLRRVDAAAGVGAAHARNVGARAARGAMLIFVDADDVVCSDYLTAMHRALQNVSLIAARQQLAETTANALLVPEPPPDRLKEAYGFWPSAGGVLGIRTVDFERIGGFDETLLAGEDIDFWWRARLASISMDLEPSAVVEIYHHAGPRGSFRRGRSHGLAGPKLYQKYRSHGMPRRRWRAVIRFYGGLFARLPRLRTRTDFDAWMFLAGYRVGVVEGCFRERVLYL